MVAPISDTIREAVRSALREAEWIDRTEIRDIALMLCHARPACCISTSRAQVRALLEAAEKDGFSVVRGKKHAAVANDLSTATEIVRLFDLIPGITRSDHQRIGTLLGYPASAVSKWGSGPSPVRNWSVDERRFLICNHDRDDEPVARAWTKALLAAFTAAYGLDAVRLIPELQFGG